MKKLLLSGLVVLFSSSVFAQITLTAAAGYSAGNSYTLQPCTTSGSMPSASGANVSVDYSTFTPNGATATQAFVDPASTPYASSFPMATVAQPSTSVQGVTGYTYYKTTATKIEIVGLGTTAYTMTYPNLCTMMSYPMSYMDHATDTFSAQYSVNGVDIKRTGYITMDADAYGTIKTPAGTSPYLRIVTIQQIIDSFVMAGSLVQLSFSEITTYNYMNNSSSIPLFSYSEIVTGQGTATSAYYNTAAPTGISEGSGNIKALSVYPNPAADHITIATNLLSEETVTTRITDITGREVSIPVTKTFSTGTNELVQNISALAPGMYSVVLQSESGGTRSVKFTVQ